MEKQRILLVRFKNEIWQNELPLFRGAVIASMEKADILFHNHQGESYRYAYPLIQYKRINRHAAIVCINEGADAIGDFFGEYSQEMTLAGKPIVAEIDSVNASMYLIQVWEDMFSYTIRKWLPLNQKNYAEYSHMEGIAEKSAYLEKMLIGNILSMAKGLGIKLDKQVEVKITNLEELRNVVHKGVKMQAFDAEFKTNVSIPDYIGLGKGVSLGFGMVVRKKNNTNSR